MVLIPSGSPCSSKVPFHFKFSVHVDLIFLYVQGSKWSSEFYCAIRLLVVPNKDHLFEPDSTNSSHNIGEFALDNILISSIQFIPFVRE